ncbi:MAG: hypothetical protein Q9221_007680 [Calogaya cf. arnoldii]
MANGISKDRDYSHLESVDRDLVEPVAVVGLSFGFPGEATSSEAFWELLMEGRGTATEFPQSRMNISGMYHPDQNRKGQLPVRKAHFLQQDISAFDAPFFSISSTDATLMDPQQRMLLEHTYKALENGSRTSVYTGAFTHDWQLTSFKDSEECGTTTALGVQPCVCANRISWFYDFKGNSANIDTACSSSLVALDMGCKDLRNGEVNMSIVGGSNLIFSPDYLHSLSNMNMLSVDGECYSFDHRGTGYGRGEGIGILVLKRLSDALLDQDTIRAIIRNTRCNQDGNTPGITQPSSASQKTLIEETYASAGLSKLPTRYFEAHGTGTPIGDPAEANAMGSAFSKARTTKDPLWIGAVKSNLGHLEGCSGIASVIKTILVLEKGVIPPNINFEQVNPKIDTEFLKIKFPLVAVPWPCEGLRRASINSFGYAGTNAHVVLDDALHYLEGRQLIGNHATTRKAEASMTSESTSLPENFNTHDLEQLVQIPRTLVFSSQDELGMKRQIAAYKSYFTDLTISPGGFEDYLNHLVYTLDRRRTALAQRSIAVIESMEDLLNLETIVSPTHMATSEPALGFVFTGQGAQWPKMGRELVVFPVFAESLRNSQSYLQELDCSWSLEDELLKQAEQTNIHYPEYSQPICTALQIALVDLLDEFGIQPTVVVGHSSGEIAAAYSHGSISAKAAMKIAYFRGVVSARLAKNPSTRGGMLALGLSHADVQPQIDAFATHYGTCNLAVACINSGRNVTLSGPLAQIDALHVMMDQRGIFARKLKVDVAYHSPQMQQVGETYRQMIQHIEKGSKSSSRGTMVSTVTGNRVEPADLQSPEYWVANMQSPVRFSKVLSDLVNEKSSKDRKKLDLSHRDRLNLHQLVELGPHAALQGAIRDILTDKHRSNNVGYTSILRRGFSASRSAMEAVGELKCIGYPIDLVNVCLPKHIRREDLMALPNLPAYQFDHTKSYWYESRLSSNLRTQPQGKLDLLGKPVPDWNPLEPRWRNHLRISEMPWMEDHVINGATIYPGAGMLAMAIEAAHQMADQSQQIQSVELKDVHFVEPLNIPRDASGLETQFTIRLSKASSYPVSQWSEFRLCAYDTHQWHESCCGFVRIQYDKGQGEVDRGKETTQELEACREIQANMTKDCQTPVDRGLFYRNLSQSGYDIGPSFQRIYNAALGQDQQAKGDIQVFRWPECEYPQPHIVHPTTLDAILQMSVGVLTEGGREDIQTMIPHSLGYLKVSQKGLSYPEATNIKACAQMTAQYTRGADFDYTCLDNAQSRVLAQVKELKLTVVAGSATNDTHELDQEWPECFHVEYKPDLEMLITSQELAGPKNTETSIDDYLKMLAHKTPGMRVLEIGATRTEITQQLSLEGLRERLNMGLFSYHYTSMSSLTLDLLRAQFARYAHLTFDTLNINLDPLEQGLETEAYDIIVAPDLCDLDVDIEAVLTRMLKVSKAGSWLLFGRQGESADKRTQWREILAGGKDSSSGFTSNSTLHTVRNSQNLTVLRQSTNLTQRPDKEIVLIIDPTFHPQVRLAERIAQDFRENYTRCRIFVQSLEQAAERQADKDLVHVVLLEFYKPLLYDISETTYALLRMVLFSATDIVWIGISETGQLRKPEFAVVDGLARVMRNERDDYRFTTVFFVFEKSALTNRQLEQLRHVLDKNHLGPDPGASRNEPEFFEIDGILNIPRLVGRNDLGQELHARSLPQRSSFRSVQTAPPVMLTVGSPGLLDTLHFVEDEEFSRPLIEGEVEIRTQAIGVNFKDTLAALAQIPISSLGLECAGTVTRVGAGTALALGDRVVMASQGCFKTFARGPSSATFKIPKAMSSVEAAAITAQFSTARAVICHVARLRAGETILIHAAAGGTGQACIQIAQMFNATVLTTVGSTDKKRLLIKEYGISEHHIFDSRNLSFADGVKRVTKGRGVDVVINSLPSEALMASWDCIAPYGRFIEIGKKDIAANSNLPMSAFAKNAAFIGFDMGIFAKERPLEARANLETLMDMFSKKQLRVQHPLHVYRISDCQEVFRLLSSGRHAGKFVLEVSPDAQIHVRYPRFYVFSSFGVLLLTSALGQTTLPSTAGFSLDPEATYVIAGGLGGLGRSTARWMVARNARNLILLSRYGVKDDNGKAFVEELTSKGVHTEAPACDISNSEVMGRVLGSLIQMMPPVKGCVQASMVARDVLFQDMSFNDWQAGVACKTSGSFNLHTVLPDGMGFFILLSSASGLVGLRGQANYNAGNTYEDAFARWRTESCGDKTISLNLGAMVDDGILAENPEALQRVLTYGTLQPITRARYFAILDYYCDHETRISNPTESQMAMGVSVGSATDGALQGMNLARHPLFRHLVYQSHSASKDFAGVENDDRYFRALYSEATSLPEAALVVIKAVAKKLAKTVPDIPQSVEEVDFNRRIQSYGVDSLLAVELRDWIKKELKAEVAVFETQGASTFFTLGRVVAERSALEHKKWVL